MRFRRRTGGRFFVTGRLMDTDEGDVVVAREFCSVICTPGWRKKSIDAPYGLRAQFAAANDSPATPPPVLPPLTIMPPPYMSPRGLR